MLPGGLHRRKVLSEHRAANNFDAVLWQSASPADSEVSEHRRQFRELASAQPLPAGATVTATALGGGPTAEITVGGIEPRHVVLYLSHVSYLHHRLHRRTRPRRRQCPDG